MARFYTYETVDIPLKFEPEGVLEGYRHIVVSLSQSGIQIDKTEEELGIDVAEDLINISLSQEETAMFNGGDKNNPKQVLIQVNIYYDNTDRDVSCIESIDVYDNLYKKVINDA